MRYVEFRLIAECIDKESIEYLTQVKQPSRLLKRRWVGILHKICALYSSAKEWLKSDFKTLSNLNELTIGEYLLLTTLQGESLIYETFKTLYGFEKTQVDAMNVDEVFGVMNFVRGEIERINKLFESTRIDTRQEEENAGIKNVNSVGTFAVIDYISKRQHITIEQAEKMKWKVVFALMRIDKDSEEYKRRLEAEYRKKK